MPPIEKRNARNITKALFDADARAGTPLGSPLLCGLLAQGAPPTQALLGPGEGAWAWDWPQAWLLGRRRASAATGMGWAAW